MLLKHIDDLTLPIFYLAGPPAKFLPRQFDRRSYLYFGKEIVPEPTPIARPWGAILAQYNGEPPAHL